MSSLKCEGKGTNCNQEDCMAMNPDFHCDKAKFHRNAAPRIQLSGGKTLGIAGVEIGEETVRPAKK